MKTEAQFEYDKKRCKYCKGTGIDTFDKSKACPNCSKELIIVKSRKMGMTKMTSELLFKPKVFNIKFNRYKEITYTVIAANYAEAEKQAIEMQEAGVMPNDSIDSHWKIVK